MPAVDPARYDSPEAYLEAVRYRPIDESFSWITSRESFDALFRSSQSVGIGISTTVRGGEMRVLQVFPGSAGADAGLSRGDRIVEINRQAVATLIANNQIDSAFGASDEGVEVDIAFITTAGAPRTARIVKRPYTDSHPVAYASLHSRRKTCGLHLPPQLRRAFLRSARCGVCDARIRTDRRSRPRPSL